MLRDNRVRLATCASVRICRRRCYLQAAEFQITSPTGPVRVPLGVITKFIMAKTEPIKAKTSATTTPTNVRSHSLKLTSGCGCCCCGGWPKLSALWLCAKKGRITACVGKELRLDVLIEFRCWKTTPPSPSPSRELNLDLD